MSNASFQRWAGYSAIFVALGGLAYGVLFAMIVAGTSETVLEAWISLAVFGGLAVTVVFVALHQRLRLVDRAVSTWAVLLGVVAGLGQMLNASVALGYQLDTAARPPGEFDGTPDPLGILRFALNGVALLLFGWLMIRGGDFPKPLGYLAQIAGVLLLISYVGRLTGLVDPADRVTLVPPLLYGFVAHPVLYLWLGRHLLRPAVVIEGEEPS
jgi:hypothetical protein